MEQESDPNKTIMAEQAARGEQLKEAFKEGVPWKADPETGKPVLLGDPGYEEITEEKFDSGAEKVQKQTLLDKIRRSLSNWIRE